MSKSALEAHRAKFELRPQHSSTLIYWRTLWGKWLLGFSVVTLASLVVIVLGEEGFWWVMAWPVCLMAVIASLGSLFEYARARMLERHFGQVWADDSEWALATLGTYHTSQMAVNEEQRRQRRDRGLKVVAMLALCALCLVLLFSSLVHPTWLVMALVVVLMLGGLMLCQQVYKFSLISEQLRRQERERKILRHSFAQLPDSASRVGALSFLSTDEQSRGALSTAHDTAEGRHEEDKDGSD
jgi:hypothetical protein